MTTIQYKELQEYEFRTYKFEDGKTVLIKKEFCIEGLNFTVYLYDESEPYNYLESTRKIEKVVEDEYNYYECVFCRDITTSFEEIIEFLELNKK